MQSRQLLQFAGWLLSIQALITTCRLCPCPSLDTGHWTLALSSSAPLLLHGAYVIFPHCYSHDTYVIQRYYAAFTWHSNAIFQRYCTAILMTLMSSSIFTLPSRGLNLNVIFQRFYTAPSHDTAWRRLPTLLHYPVTWHCMTTSSNVATLPHHLTLHDDVFQRYYAACDSQETYVIVQR